MKIRQAVALLMIAIGMGAAQDRLAETLRKGVVEEEKNQNLNAAIQAYQSVLSQFDQDRQTAATALFRLAECYRKQGKNDQAIAAYKRVASEFQDQTKLAEQSRTVLAQTFKAQTDQAAGQAVLAQRARLEADMAKIQAQLEREKKANNLAAVRKLQAEYAERRRQLETARGDSSAADARRRYKELTEAQIREVRAQLAGEQKKFDLGVTGDRESILQVQSRLNALERQLAIIDAPPGEASAAEARRAFRAHLEEQIRLEESRYKMAQNEFNLGKVDQFFVTDARVRLLDLQRQLAALDAGMVEPSTTSPPR